MQDAGNIAVNTTNDILIDIEPRFPWLFQSNSQEDWWSVHCELVRKHEGLQAPTDSFPFLPLWSHHVPLSHLIVFQLPWLPFYLRHIKLISFPGFDFCSWVPGMCFLQTPTRLSLLNIQIIVSARPSLTNTSETCLHPTYPVTLHRNILFCFLQNTYYLKVPCFFMCCFGTCLSPLRCSSIQARSCLFWSPKYPQFLLHLAHNSLQISVEYKWIP